MPRERLNCFEKISVFPINYIAASAAAMFCRRRGI